VVREELIGFHVGISLKVKASVGDQPHARARRESIGQRERYSLMMSLGVVPERARSLDARYHRRPSRRAKSSKKRRVALIVIEVGISSSGDASRAG